MLSKCKVFVVLLLTLMTLSSCSFVQEPLELSGKVYDLQIPVADKTLLVVPIPVECQLMSTSNISEYHFSNDVDIYCTGKTTHTGKYDEATDCYTNLTGGVNYVSRDFGDKTITVSFTNGSMKSYWLSIISTAQTVTVSTVLELESFFEIKNSIDKSSDMYISDNGLYIPRETEMDTTSVEMNNLSADLISYGDKFLFVFRQDGRIEDIKDLMLTYAICNSGSNGVDHWYTDDNTLYVEAGTNTLMCKKLTANSWCIYVGTNNFKDYILTAWKYVHFGG